MPKKPVSDPITGQEIAFAHLILSGTMTDRRAAEAAGLNPETAAYTKAKPRVRAYMIEHRAAVREKLVDQEADGLRNLNLGRDQILKRLWELANLSPEVTRGIIAGQIKAMSMIIAIEGLIPDRRLSPSQTQSAAPPAQPLMDVSAWRRDAVTAVEAQPRTPPATSPGTPHAPAPAFDPEPPPQPAKHAPSPHLDRNHASPANPFIHPERMSRMPDATGYIFDTVLNPTSSLRLPHSSKQRPFARGR